MDGPKSFASTSFNGNYFFLSKIYINQNGSVQMNLKWMLLTNSRNWQMSIIFWSLLSKQTDIKEFHAITQKSLISGHKENFLLSNLCGNGFIYTSY